MKVKLEEWIPVAYWIWDVKDEDDICGICQNAFDGVCGTCDEPGDQCPLLFGTCSHIFHMHCILRWTEKMQPDPLCPLCKRKWQEQKQVAKEDKDAEHSRMASFIQGPPNVSIEIASQSMQENIPTQIAPTNQQQQQQSWQQSQSQAQHSSEADSVSGAVGSPRSSEEDEL